MTNARLSADMRRTILRQGSLPPKTTSSAASSPASQPVRRMNDDFSGNQTALQLDAMPVLAR